MRTKTENVLVRFKPEVKKMFLEVAEDKGLSMSALITFLVIREHKEMMKEKEAYKHQEK